MFKFEWYCTYCQEWVDCRNVTYEEKHEKCGHGVEVWPTEELEDDSDEP